MKSAGKTIGMIGGMSCESSVEYYRRINAEVKRRLGGNHNARSLMLSLDFEELAALQTAGHWDEAGALLAGMARRLEAGGADCVLICANTMHKAYAAVASVVAIPVLHIADATGAAIRAAGLSSVGLMGTRFTMNEGFYRDRLQAQFGLEVLLPAEPGRSEIDRLIYAELCYGKFTEAARRFFLAEIEALRKAGAEGVVLGCTEIPLLISQADCELPLFDTLALHAQAAVDFALAEVEQAAPIAPVLE